MADRGPEAARVVFVTGPDRETVSGLGRAVVRERLAACVNVLGPVASVYRWEGEVAEATEAMAVIKTTADRLDRLRERILELHPYDTPEFVALPVTGGSEAYLQWIGESVSEG